MTCAGLLVRAGGGAVCGGGRGRAGGGSWDVQADRQPARSGGACGECLVHDLADVCGAGLHCLREAVRAGYRAMQFNFVVSTNTAAVALWQKLGFAIVGTLPKAFRHSQPGHVDAYVMHRFLDDIEA